MYFCELPDSLSLHNTRKTHYTAISITTVAWQQIFSLAEPAVILYRVYFVLSVNPMQWIIISQCFFKLNITFKNNVSIHMPVIDMALTSKTRKSGSITEKVFQGIRERRKQEKRRTQISAAAVVICSFEHTVVYGFEMDSSVILLCVSNIHCF